MSQPLKLLLLEDSDDDAFLVLTALRRADYDVTYRREQSADGLREALDAGGWEVVISDFRMPGFTALDALAVLRERGLDLPFIIVSGTVGEDTAVEAMRLGAHDYFLKGQLTRLPAAIERERAHAEQRRERARAEQALRESERRFRRLMENAPDVIWRFDLLPERRFAYVGPAVQRVLGLLPDDHYRAPELWLERVHPRHREVLESLLGPIAEAVQAEICFLHPERGEIDLDVHVAPLRDEQGRVVAVEGIARDVTDRRRLEKQLSAMQRIESIGRLAGGVAHDFNNLLTVIDAYVALLLDAIEEESPLREDVAQIREASMRAAELTRQLLAFSRHRAESRSLLNPHEVVRGLEAMLRRLLREDVALEIEVEPELPLVRMDRGRLEQVLMNLVVNAHDAMPEGGLLSVGCRRVERPAALELQGGSYVALEVADTGTGIPQAVRERVFEPFFTTKPLGRGTGLGLSTVYGIVRQSEGTVEVESELGQGTTFRVLLPAATGSVTDVGPGVSAAAPAPILRRVLLVEDDPVVREATARLLQSGGCEVRSAGTTAAALKLAGQEEFDVLVTDLVMPGGNGLELAEALRRQRPDIGVVVMSGYAAEVDGDRLATERFLQKPFGRRELLDAVAAAREA